jgi:hypothetical protein
MAAKKKNPVGRPTKYNKEMQRQADEYVTCFESLGHAVPSRAGLCCYLGIAKSTSYEWEQTYPEFSDSLAYIDVMQEHCTVNGGLKNEFNSTIAKLILSNNHGYSEKTQQDNISTDGSMSPTRIEIVAPDGDGTD